MKINDTTLIKCFGSDEITRELLINNEMSFVIVSEDMDYDVNEMISVINNFPDILKPNIVYTKIEDIIRLVNCFNDKVCIRLDGVTKENFDTIPEELFKNRECIISFDCTDKYIETINIGDIANKFPKIIATNYSCVLSSINVTSFNQITYMAEVLATLDIEPELLKDYKQAIKEFPQIASKDDLAFGNRTIYNITKWSLGYSNNIENVLIPGCELKNIDDYSNLKGKEVIILSNSMADAPFNLIEKLKDENINCLIAMHSYDNGEFQNDCYELDEYIQMYKKMLELIGDIDDNLPEEEKFARIYERIITYSEYDTAAAYPKTQEEEEYYNSNLKNSRNLRNLLLKGVGVCAASSDLLRNACLIKGIECEFDGGPVDRIEEINSKVDENNSDRSTNIIYENDKIAVIRENHAWNKVRINGIWYNCDPTFDKYDIINRIVPRWSFLSDNSLKKLGRATVGNFRHPCTVDMSNEEKKKLFKNFELGEDLFYDERLINFESNLDEYGNQLPVVQKKFSWSKIIDDLKKFAKNIFTKIGNKINNKNKEKMNNSFTNNELIDKKTSWELSKEDLKVVENKLKFNNKDKNNIEQKDNLEIRNER